MLLGIGKIDYKENEVYQTHLLEQYKTYSAKITSELNRSETINGFFLTINTAVISIPVFSKKNAICLPPEYGFLTLTAVFICLLWWLILLSSARWQAALLETIQDIEVHLPIKPFTVEWHEKLKPSSKYLKIRYIKLAVPFVFLFLHTGLLLLKMNNT